ncbi:uncharacterized protein STEHIDRAFT_119793 [Stereum hirsutum FP-91666 SS1]|uniref:uncharacterized protein n=1 Tax=Stereum hirsutum (strain FP-91666) TaxID=721885 RepID=UPI000440C7E5|nr:uncharacterized protein STEHIDRAFT_119793 [Stereum hirsutum FP-91666 SS1]EIM89031.1 hypothetical protein STEHIDRAFT_119793 [Stereum hirsutum FP-91666 SS1]
MLALSPVFSTDPPDGTNVCMQLCSSRILRPKAPHFRNLQWLRATPHYDRLSGGVCGETLGCSLSL